MILVWILLGVTIGAAGGFFVGQAMAAREARRESDDTSTVHGRERARLDQQLAERGTELGAEREATAGLRRQAGELEGEVGRQRRWAETQFKALLAEFQSAWDAADLPLQFSEDYPPLPEGARPHLESLAGRLGVWADELGLGSADLSFQLGLWYALNRRLKEAADKFQEAALKGLGAEAWLALGDTLWALERPEKARNAYKNCLRMSAIPDHVSYRYAKASIEKREYREGIAALEQILGKGPHPPEVYALAAFAHTKLHQNEKAIQACMDGLRLHQTAELYARMILPLMALGQKERAEDVYLKALELDARSAEAACAMGVAHLQRGDEKAAGQFLREAVELNPGYPDSYNWLGVIHNRQREFRKAIQYFAKAVEVHPSYAEAYYNMKDSYEGLRDFDQAVAMLKRAITLNPDFEVAPPGTTTASFRRVAP